MAAPTGVAAFDFDGTITKRDTLFPFLARTCGWPKAALAMAGQGRYLSGRKQPDFRDGVKERVLRQLLAGRDASELHRDGESYAQSLPRLYRRNAVNRIAWHREQGHVLVLVSASLHAYAQPAAAALGFQHTIAVELAQSSSGTLTGHMLYPNVRAEQKAVRLRSWLAQEFSGPTELWAYGNSSGDTEMLDMAQHPTWIKDLDQ